VLKISGDEELDKLEITIHYECLLKFLKGEEDE